jgi:hypothetical protein
LATGGRRISYAGVQGAFAFCIYIFQGFTPETNFTTIRDPLVGLSLSEVDLSAFAIGWHIGWVHWNHIPR